MLTFDKLSFIILTNTTISRYFKGEIKKMAWKNKYRTTKKPKTSSRLRRPKYSELEKLAFKLGQVQRGLRNPDSRVFESYNNGKKSPMKKRRKSLL